MINSKQYLILLILLSISISCKNENNGNETRISNSIDLTVTDPTGRFDGRNLKFQIFENYQTGEFKRIHYSFGDTILEHHLLQTGFIYKKNTYVNGEIVDKINSNQFQWDYKNLYKVNLVVEQYSGDTLNIWINDDSYIWSEEYVRWKSDYFIWKNHDNVKDIKLVKTRFIQDGKDKAQDFLYSKNEIDDIYSLYSTNDKFEKIALNVLSKFGATDIINLRNAHHFLNEEEKEYDLDLVSLFLDFSLCKTDCFAEKRLRYIGNMLQDIKLNDFWSENKIEPDEFIKKLNEVFKIMNKDKI